ncbi:MAG: class I SAM-dependent methyltransferase [bacterium]
MKRDNHETARAYFDVLGYESGERFASDNELLRTSILPLLAKRAKGRTLLAGWSPTLKFTPPTSSHLVVADFAPRVLKCVPKRPNTDVICATVESLPFESYVFDTIFMLGILHHLTEDNTVETDKVLHNMFFEMSRLMRRDSRLYILEPFVSPFLEVVNRTLFFPMRMLMNSRGLPMMCFFSIPNLKMLLDDSGMELLYKTPVGIGGKIPVSWFLPTRKIDYRYLPQKIFLLEIKKKT